MKMLQTLMFSSSAALFLLVGMPTPANALSFIEGTVFLEATSEAECTAQEGDFIEWLDEIYCTQAPPVTDQIAAAKALDLIGMEVNQAQALAEEANVLFRVVEIDGEPQIVTKDYRIGRINASTEASIVTEVRIEGDEVVDEEPTEAVPDEKRSLMLEVIQLLETLISLLQQRI